MIEGNIIALYGNYREKASAKAVMEIRISLLETRNGGESASVFGSTYKSSVGFDSDGADGLIIAFDKCLEQILRGLEDDLLEKLL